MLSPHKTGISLLLVFMYGVLFVYIYSLIAFAFYREIHPNETGLYCERAFQCFITYLHHGLVIGTYEVSIHGFEPGSKCIMHTSLSNIDIAVHISFGLEAVYLCSPLCRLTYAVDLRVYQPWD